MMGKLSFFAHYQVKVIATPGHTLGGVCFYIAEENILFTGDTLFSMGCGRLFEGTAAQMWESLEKIKSLPDKTMLYCGHEYTEQNALFALEVEPENKELQARYKEVKELRSQEKASLPVSLEMEKQTNPFLRAHQDIYRDYFNCFESDSWKVFALLREKKIVFRFL